MSGKKKFTPEQLAAEYLRRSKEEPYQAFTPTGKGEEFLDKTMGGKYMVTLFSAANGVGKSALCMNILAHLFWPCENIFFQAKLFKEWPHLKKVRIVSDPTNISKNLVPELKKWFPTGRYTCTKEGRPYETKWKTDTGWELDIMSTEQDPKEFESVNLGLIWIDEPCPESIYKACISRLRMGGLMFMSATPLKGSAWMYDKMICGLDDEGGLRTYVEADVWSASKTRGVRGFLDDENIKRMIAQYDEDDMQARVYGKFQHLAGMVFKKWSRKIHVIKPFAINRRDYVVWEMFDPHPRTNDAVLWGAVDKYGRKFVIDELFMKGTTEDISFQVKKRDDMYRIEQRFMDAWAFSDDQHSERSLADRFADHGLVYQKAPKKRSMADRRIQEALVFQEKGDVLVDPPEVYVFSTCTRTIYEMEHYQWDDWSGKLADRRGEKQTPIDKDDHMIENLGRFLIQEPRFFPQPIVQGHGPLDEILGEKEETMLGDPY